LGCAITQTSFEYNIPQMIFLSFDSDVCRVKQHRLAKRNALGCNAAPGKAKLQNRRSDASILSDGFIENLFPAPA
jgi:hypothetical protein